MATAARLAALVSVALATTLILLTSTGGDGLIALMGWIAVALLGAGLMLGHRGGLTALSVGFVLRLGLMSAMDAPIQPDLWTQVLLLTLALEAGSVSFTLRMRPADPLSVMVRGVGTAFIAAGLVRVMELLVAGADTSGVLVRVAGIAALVVAAGWVTTLWRRSGLAG